MGKNKMSTFRINLDEAKKLRSSKDLSNDEIRQILERLKEAPNDEELIPILMKEFNISKTTIAKLVVDDMLEIKGK